MRSLVTKIFGKKIFDVQPDGLIEAAPVYVEYLVKVMTSVSITYAIYCFTVWPILVCAYFGSFAMYALLVLYKLWKGVDPKLTLMQVIGDAITDCALASVAFVGAVFAIAPLYGTALLVADYAIYRIFVQFARPGDNG